MTKQTKNNPSVKQRIETHLSDKIDFKLTDKTKDRLSDRMQDRFTNKSQSGSNIGAPPHINSWSDSRPQKKTGI
jgi:hypothetical protein